MTLAQPRKVRLSQRWKYRHPSKPKAIAPTPTAPLTAADQARVNKWIRDRLVADWRESCWRCRLRILVGQKFIDVRGDEVIVRFHTQCESEWRAQQEAAARRAMGLDRSEPE
jgi:hypothetical protein